jgi:hypothetical protein
VLARLKAGVHHHDHDHLFKAVRLYRGPPQQPSAILLRLGSPRLTSARRTRGPPDAAIAQPKSSLRARCQVASSGESNVDSGPSKTS